MTLGFSPISQWIGVSSSLSGYHRLRLSPKALRVQAAAAGALRALAADPDNEVPIVDANGIHSLESRRNLDLALSVPKPLGPWQLSQ